MVDDILTHEGYLSMALDCYCNRGILPDEETIDKDIIATAIDHELINKVEDGYQFSDEEQLLQSAALALIQEVEISEWQDVDGILDRLDEKSNINVAEKNKLVGVTLARLHNTACIDIFRLAKAAVADGEKAFTLAFILEHAVPRLNTATAEAIYEFFDACHEQVKNDLFRGRLPQAFVPWFTNHIDITKELKSIHEAKLQDGGADIYLASLQALILSDFTGGFQTLLELSGSTDNRIAASSLQAMYSADYSSPDRRKQLKTVEERCFELANSGRDSVVFSATNTLCELVRYCSDEHPTIIHSLLENGHQDALFAVSRFLFLYQNEYSTKSWYQELVFHYSSHSSLPKGTLDNLDHILLGWLNDDNYRESAINFITDWVGNQPVGEIQNGGIGSRYSSFSARLIEHPSTLSSLITDWILDDNIVYPWAAQRLVADLRVNRLSELPLDTNKLDSLDTDHLVFAVRRILGFFLDDTIQLSMSFSLLMINRAQERTFGMIGSVYLDRIGEDFPSAVIEYLERKTKDNTISEDIREFCTEIVTIIKNKQNTLQELPDMVEFHPNEMKRSRFSKERQKQMSEAIEKAHKDSVFMSIVTTTPLKAGRRSFNRMHGGFSDPMELQEYSHSIQIPRSEIYDPIGTERERFLYRIAKLGDS